MSSGTAAYAASATVYGRNAADSYYQLNGTGPLPPPPNPNVDIAGSLTVSGDSILVGPVEMDAGLAVTGLISSTTLSVQGAAAVGSLNVSGAVSAGNLNASVAIATAGSLNVSGATVLGGKMTLGLYNGDPAGGLLQAPVYSSQGTGTLATSLLWDFGPGGAAYNAGLNVPGLYFFRMYLNLPSQTYCSFFVDYFDEDNPNAPKVRANVGTDVVPLQDFSGAVFSYTGLRVTVDPAEPSKMFVSLAGSSPAAEGPTSFNIGMRSATRVA